MQPRGNIGPPLTDVLKEVGLYLKAPIGSLSLSPLILSLLDVWLNLLPISAVVRPAVYVLLIAGAVFGLYFEVARNINVTKKDAAFSEMPRRAAILFAIGMVLFLAYVAGLSVIDEHLPPSAALSLALVWSWTAMLVVALIMIAMSLTVLGLRTYIGIYRS